MKKNLLITFLLPLSLIACSDNSNSDLSQTEKAPVTQQQNQSSEKITAAIEPPIAAQTKTITISEHKQQKPQNTAELVLPQGRLSSIISTGDTKQATVKLDDRTLTFQEQDVWDQWKIIRINPNNVVVSLNGQDRMIEIAALDAPQLSTAEKARREQRIKAFSNSQQQNTAKDEQPKLVLSEEQKELVRSRLLETRPVNEDSKDSAGK